jgi:hypothetical protein
MFSSPFQVRREPQQLSPGARESDIAERVPGTTYEVLVLDDGFSWQGTGYRSLSALARKDHRHRVVGTALLRVEAESLRRPRFLVGTTFSQRGQRCHGVTRVAGVARSTPANPPRRGSTRNSTRSLLSAKPDDGGFSGGNMERPALQRLLADIRAGRIDIVVVYKVDRLTRSLADFARLVEIFDAEDVSFVSVTQQFNTTSSMGRLTLNLPHTIDFI